MGVRPVELRRRSAVATCAAKPNSHVRRRVRVCLHGGCQAGARRYHLAVLSEIALVHGLVRG